MARVGVAFAVIVCALSGSASAQQTALAVDAQGDVAAFSQLVRGGEHASLAVDPQGGAAAEANEPVNGVDVDGEQVDVSSAVSCQEALANASALVDVLKEKALSLKDEASAKAEALAEKLKALKEKNALEAEALTDEAWKEAKALEADKWTDEAWKEAGKDEIWVEYRALREGALQRALVEAKVLEDEALTDEALALTMALARALVWSLAKALVKAVKLWAAWVDVGSYGAVDKALSLALEALTKALALKEVVPRSSALQEALAEVLKATASASCCADRL